MNRRTIAGVVGPAVGVVCLQLLVFPAPAGVVARGVVIGLLAALVALGIALIQRSHGVLNFAQADLGAVPAALTVLLAVQSGLPWALAVAAGAGVAIVLGVTVERGIMRRFDQGSRLVATVATIGLAQLLTAGAGLLPRLWGERFVTDRLPAPFTASLTIDPIVFDANSILAVIIAPAAIAAVALVLLRTRVGLGVRAAADDSARAATLGIDVGRLRSGVWAAAALLAFVATVLRAGILGLPIGSALTLGVLLRALTAVVVGGPSLPGIALAGVGIGVLEQGVAWGEWRLLPTPADPTSPLLIDPILAVVVLAAIALRRRAAPGGRRTDVADGLVDAGATAARRRAWPRWASVAVVAVAAAAPHFLDADTSLRGSAVLIYAVLGLSIVVLTGWTGQVSLAQVAFFALGAAVAAKVTNDAGLDLTVGLAAAAGAGAAAALLVGLPVVRLRGVTLAVATLAVALAATSYLLNARFFGWLPEGRVDRPPLLGRIDLDSPTRIWYVALVALVAAIAVTRGIRDSRTGRALLAVRDNERAAAAYGLSAVRLRLFAFALSGGLAAFAGGVFVHHQQAFDLSPYAPLQNLAVLAMAVIGGVGSIGGAVLGALYLKGSEWLLPSTWRLVATGAGVLVVLIAFPNGLAGTLDVLSVRKRRPVRRERAKEPVAEGALLAVRDVDAGYGPTQVLFGIDLTVGEGEVVAVLGPNGAGKTTLARTIAGIVPPSAGGIAFDGRPLAGVQPHRVAALGIGLTQGGAAVFGSLTVDENLDVAAWLGGLVDRAEVYERFPVLSERAATPAAELSGGQQQLLALGMAMVARPRLLVVDELSLGLAPAVVASELAPLVASWTTAGSTVVLVEQSARLALDLADRAVVVVKGEVRWEGEAAALRDQPDVLADLLLERIGSDDATAARRPAVSTGDEPPALEVVDVRRRFGGVTAIDDVTLTVQPGEIVGLIGANGAGKTTLFDVISGFVLPDDGRVRLAGVDVTGWAPHQRAWAGLGRSFQDARLFPTLTVEEALAVAGERWLAVRDPALAALRLPAAAAAEADLRERVGEAMAFLGIDEWRHHVVADLPTGTRRLVDLAAVLVHRPRLVLLDEPSSGVARSEAAGLVPRLLNAHAGLGATFVIIEHDLGLVRALADRLIVLDQGAVIADGAPEAVLDDPEVRRAYLGEVSGAAR